MHEILLILALIGSLAGPVIAAVLVFRRLLPRSRMMLVIALISSCALYGYGSYLYGAALPGEDLDTGIGPQDAESMGIISGILAIVLNTVLIAVCMFIRHVVVPALRTMSRLLGKSR